MEDVTVVPTEPTMRGILIPHRRAAYALAGQAVITVRSRRTGTRFTFSVEKAEDATWGGYFVRVLTAPERYQYLGTIFPDGNFRVTRKSRIDPNAPSAVAFSFLATHWEDRRLDVWHEGVCGRCGRALTVPASIETGLGPVCAKKMAA